MIPFNKPFISGKEIEHIEKAIQHRNLAGDGFFSKKVEQQLKEISKSKNVLLTSSCTHALEMCAMLCDLKIGDEVIMSSFSFVSMVNAVVLRGAKAVFVDIRPDTMNIDEKLIEAAITVKTKAIIVMHYGSHACEMSAIMLIAKKYNLIVIEDAAHCIGAYYKNKHLGTIGHLGTISFHSTKNIHCGEGGALLINDEQFEKRAAIIREKGTNRKAFLQGEIDKYSWIDIGSSYLMSELTAAFLSEQLTHLEEITKKRKKLWCLYQAQFQSLTVRISSKYFHNAHIFYIKLKNKIERQACIDYLEEKGISTAFHYVPLHSTAAGEKYGIFHGKDIFTTIESEKLLRLPLYYYLKEDDIRYIFDNVSDFLELSKSENILC